VKEEKLPTNQRHLTAKRRVINLAFATGIVAEVESDQ
jgi:hypothetical protein